MPSGAAAQIEGGVLAEALGVAACAGGVAGWHGGTEKGHCGGASVS